MGKIRVFAPHPSILPIISTIMVKSVEPWAANTKKIYTYPPTSVHCIVLYLNGPIKAKRLTDPGFTTKSSCVVVGPQVTSVDLELWPDHKAVMICFHPGGLFRFLGIPMTAIYDDGYDGFDLLGKEIYYLIEELQDASNDEIINEKVQHYLRKKINRLQERLPFDSAIRLLNEPDSNRTISEVAKDACLSIRQFERKCQERLGVSPKLYSRIARFSKAYRLFEANQRQTWTNITYQCGYFDQMHLIRDFKAFTGTTPKIIGKQLAENELTFQAPLLLK